MQPVHIDALEAARAGAGWAFERIYEALAGPIAGYLRAQGEADPEGETNEVFLRVFRNLDGFVGGPEQLRSWVFTIAHHRIVDRRRFRSRRPVEKLVEACPELSTADAGEAALAGIEDPRLRHQLDRLAPDQRDVLLMRFVADLSLEETATAMGRTVGAVKALQHRAVAALRRNLEEIRTETVSPAADRTLTEV